MIPRMPPIGAGEYLVQYLFEAGPTMPGGMGAAPLTFSELECWQRQVGVDLDPWEVRIVRRLSLEYCAESQAATKPDAPPPFNSSDARRLQQAKIDRAMDEFL